jgi:hypothetical protein
LRCSHSYPDYEADGAEKTLKMGLYKREIIYSCRVSAHLKP